MKAAPFAYQRPGDLTEALALLSDENTKIIAAFPPAW